MGKLDTGVKLGVEIIKYPDKTREEISAIVRANNKARKEELEKKEK